MRHCACNPLSQNTTAHITTVAMDDVFCLGRRSCRVSFVFSSYSVDCIGLLYSIHVFPSRIKDGELEMDISRQKSEALKNIQPRPKNEIFLRKRVYVTEQLVYRLQSVLFNS